MPKELIHKLIGFCCCLPAIIGFIWWQFKIFWCGFPLIFDSRVWFSTTENIPNSDWALLCVIEIFILIMVLLFGGVLTIANSLTTLKEDIRETITIQLKKQPKK